MKAVLLIVGLIFPTFSFAGALPINAPPVLRFEFDDPVGSTTLRDSSGRDHDATCTTCPDLVPGAFDSHIACNGSSDFVDIPLTTGLSTAAGSASMWFRTTQTDRRHLAYFCGATCGDGYGNEDEWHIGLETGGTIEMYIEGGSNDVNQNGTAVVSDGEIHHVMGTWDISGNAIMYVDGVQEGSEAHNANNFGTVTVFRMCRPSNASRYFGGRLYELTMWNVQLSFAEVQAMYRFGRRQYQPQLDDFMLFEEGMDFISRFYRFVNRFV